MLTLTPRELHFVRIGIKPVDLDQDTFTALRMETGWSPVEPPTTLSEEQGMQVGSGIEVCPFCHGSKVLNVPHRGVKSGLGRMAPLGCDCVAWTYFSKLWEGVPSLYRGVNLRTMQVSPECPVGFEEDVADLIAHVQANPWQSLTLMGVAGIGKTHLGFALMREACLERARQSARANSCDTERCPSVWSVEAAELFEEHHAHSLASAETKAETIPSLTREKIIAAARAGYRPFVMIDELDKVSKITPFRYGVLAGIVNEVYKAQGQIVVTTNLRFEALEALVSGGLDADCGNSIMRRLVGTADPDDRKPHCVAIF